VNILKDMIKAILFDFGGVLAEEAFKERLATLGKEKGSTQIISLTF